jgi:penicillin-binding protein 1A
MSTKTSANGRKRPLMKWFLIGITGLGFAASLGLAVMWSIYAREANGFLQLFALRVPKTITKVLDRNGDIIGVFAEEHRVVIPYGDIPRAFIGGLIATEDANFLKHSGVSSKGFARALWNFVRSGGKRREGASTLTMQLVRTVTAKRQKRLNRKLKEIVLATKLEKAYTKKQILEMYANEVYFGGGRYGIEAASQYYFRKSAPQLTIEEGAMMAGMVQQPERFAKLLFSMNPKDREIVRNRRNHVLGRMGAEGYLKVSDALAISERPIRLARENAQDEQIAPYAVEEVRKYLYEKYGKDAVLNQGLEVHTTIDSVWQEAATAAVRKGLKAVDRKRGFRKDGLQFVADPATAKLQGWGRYCEVGDSIRGVILGWNKGSATVKIGPRELVVAPAGFAWAGKEAAKILVPTAAPLFEVKETDGAGTPTRLELDQEPEVEGALLAMNPASGEIRAMVGGYDFNRSKFNRAFQAQRQVGSTMKAFVYGAAFALGNTPATMVEDVPTRFMDSNLFVVEDGEARPANKNAKVYEPKNYEGDFWGPISIWEAIRDSRNVAAVRTLDTVGIRNAVELARRVGIQGTLPPYPSLALGSADLTLKDMVRGYSTFANYGRQAPPPLLISKVMDRHGKTLEQHAPGDPGDPVVDEMTAFQLIQCLQGVATQGTGARTNELNWPVAGKTGTTDEYTDAWFVGFSTRIACGVWVGLDAKKTIYKSADGGKVAVPIWTDFMKTALAGTPREEFRVPEGMVFADIDNYTGLIATSATTEKVIHLAFKPGTAPKDPSDAEAIAKVREARAKAGSQPAENRMWGSTSPPELPVPVPVDWSKTEDPNKPEPKEE